MPTDEHTHRRDVGNEVNLCNILTLSGSTKTDAIINIFSKLR